jgi:hypothetical protein
VGEISRDQEHEVVYFAGETPRQLKLPQDFLDACPKQVQAKFSQILLAVAQAPPNRFSGGGYWEAMRGDLKGIFEVRADFKKQHYRLFCLLDYEALGKDWPLLAVLAGMQKSRGTVFSELEYADILLCRILYLKTNPRLIA